jgi:mono/diheme cytochrome c family protein
MNPPPRDFTGPSARAELDRERMLRAVTHGRPDTAMAGFAGQLDPAQIEAVVDYIRAAFIDAPETAESRAPAAEPAPHGDYMAMPMPGGMTANPDRGEALYRVNCTACHGEAGDGRGPRAYFIIPKPRNFTQPAARQTLNRPTLFEAIANGRVGTEMPAWKQVLSPQDIADLAEYVFRSFIHGGELAQRDST